MAKSLDIILGAKDKFSAVFNKFSKGTKDAGNDTKKLSREARRAQKDIRGMAASMGKMTGAFFAAGVAVKAFGFAFNALSDAIRDGVQGFFNQEKQLRELAVNFQQLGVDVDSSMASVIEWSGQMQWAFGIADDMSQKLMNLAMSMGYGVEESKDLVEIAIGIAAQYGISVEEAMKKVAKAQQGNVEGMRELIPEIGYAANAQEAWNLILNESNEGLEKQAANTQSLEGQIAQLKMAIGDVVEALLQNFGPALTEVFKQGVVEINVLDKRLKMWAAWVKAFVWEFTSIWKRTFGSIGDHAFTLFYNIGVGIGNFVKTAANQFVKLGKIVAGIFGDVWEWVSSGMTGGLSGLTERVVESVQEGLNSEDAFKMGHYAQYASNPMGEAPRNPYIDDLVEAQDDFNKSHEKATKEIAAAYGPAMAGDTLKQDARGLMKQQTTDSGLGSLQSNRFLTSGRSIAKDPQLLTAENTKKTAEGVNEMVEQQAVMNGNFEQFMEQAQGSGV